MARSKPCKGRFNEQWPIKYIRRNWSFSNFINIHLLSFYKFEEVLRSTTFILRLFLTFILKFNIIFHIILYSVYNFAYLPPFACHPSSFDRHVTTLPLLK